ncbi:DNA mismatch repair protein MutT [Marinobacter salinus]|uniref:8-oxo-dGTP diphosphatase n=1 Tax=Marinobacter salinus TaxID=1874317 RepID=A0A1D9GMA4_9GAMM|nr:Nudix family hydrolase [Marinobacter salinus]AOY88739.1 DNA mismatch repair protein MutT [Marinobacter salinus]
MADKTAAKRETHVAVAVIIRDGRVLIARRPKHVHQGGLLEFPGGKVEPGETVQRALVREVAEETGLKVPESSLEPVIGIRHDYGDKCVFLDVWQTTSAKGEAEGREGQPLAWMLPMDMRDQDFPAANRPIIRALRLPSLLAITGDIEKVEQGCEQLASALKRWSPPLVVVRAPLLNGGDYRRLVASATRVCAREGAGLIVHGGPSVFQDAPEAAGLHLPWREASRLSSRPIPGHAWLGVSCHDAGQIGHAVRLGADYVTFGPVKATATHPDAVSIGWPAFRESVSMAPLPVFGLGGLGPGDVLRARQEGGQGVAGIRFWWSEN